MTCDHIKKYTPKFLPNGQYLNLNQDDYKKILNHLSKDFSVNNLKKLASLRNTNKAECIHHRVFTYAPKSNIWSRNYTSLCHSAVHSDTHKTGLSTLLIAKEIGLKYCKSDPFYRHMIHTDKRFQFWKTYMKTLKYKNRRHLTRKLKCNRALLQDSMYKNNESVCVREHRYGIDPGS